jgi:hypothetical protein
MEAPWIVAPLLPLLVSISPLDAVALDIDLFGIDALYTRQDGVASPSPAGIEVFADGPDASTVRVIKPDSSFIDLECSSGFCDLPESVQDSFDTLGDLFNEFPEGAYMFRVRSLFLGFAPTPRVMVSSLSSS